MRSSLGWSGALPRCTRLHGLLGCNLIVEYFYKFRNEVSSYSGCRAFICGLKSVFWLQTAPHVCVWSVRSCFQRVKTQIYCGPGVPCFSSGDQPLHFMRSAHPNRETKAAAAEECVRAGGPSPRSPVSRGLPACHRNARKGRFMIKTKLLCPHPPPPHPSVCISRHQSLLLPSSMRKPTRSSRTPCPAS